MATHEEASTPTWSTANASVHSNVPLPTGNSSNIRLLEILNDDTDDDDEPISCRLRLASLDEEYVALSYMWGTEAATQMIRLNGQPFLVRQNLWDFLRQRQMDHSRDTKSRYLWIDALCIDQASNLERSHQVGMMGRIYSNASNVLIWLGTETESLSRTMDFLASPQKLDRILGHTERPPWRDILKIIDNDYWSRAWILQECILAAELELQCGSKRLSASTLRQVWWLYLLDYLPDDDRSIKRMFAGEVIIARDLWHDTSIRKFYTPWQPRLPLLGCSDPRDRIYAMISIMDPALRIVPDYNTTTQELFAEVVGRCVLNDEHGPLCVERIAKLLELIPSNSDQPWDWPPFVRERWREFSLQAGLGKRRKPF